MSGARPGLRPRPGGELRLQHRFDTALGKWRRLVAPGGALVVTECEWTTGQPSLGALAFWDQNYPAMRDRSANTAAAVAAGYDVLGVYGRPESDWDAYYGPLGARGVRLHRLCTAPRRRPELTRPVP